MPPTTPVPFSILRTINASDSVFSITDLQGAICTGKRGNFPVTGHVHPPLEWPKPLFLPTAVMYAYQPRVGESPFPLGGSDLGLHLPPIPGVFPNPETGKHFLGYQEKNVVGVPT